ncbi:MAG: hypothetical protein IPM48_14745 [Saprospiraceae bacterium]|nr:hypothetical protein [Saprospiraceae bacterium]
MRTAVAGGAGAVVAVSVVLKPDLENIQEYSFAILAAFVAGFIAALAKVIRDNWGSVNKDSIIDKIPA